MSTKFKFGDWLPDQESLDSPGLVECLNVLRESLNYGPYLPLTGLGTAISQTVLAARRCSGQGDNIVYVGACSGGVNKLYTGTGSGAGSWTDRTPGGLSGSASSWSIRQYNETVIATDLLDNPQYHVLGSGGNFAQLTGAYGAAPKAGVAGIIGQFVMLGNLPTIAPYAVQWSGINAPLNWPTPLSADAIAQQSGRQYLEPDYGVVRGIAQGDQWGIILMDGGLVRVSYTGGSTVFGFDTIERSPGCFSQDSWIKVGPLVYFAGPAGFYATDGTSVVPIGRGKVDKYFLSIVDQSHPGSIRTGVHWGKRLVYWTFARNGGAGVANEMLIYNIDEKNWTHVLDGVQCFVIGEEANFSAYGVEAFATANMKCGVFVGSAGTATFVTPEMELNPGGKAMVTGVTPQIAGLNAFMTVTVKIGSRDSQGDAVTLTPATSLTATTGQADFLVDARYHRAEIDIVGNFDNAIGGVFDSQPTSQF